MAQAPVAAGTGSAERQETETEKKVMERRWLDTHRPRSCCHSQWSEYNALLLQEPEEQQQLPFEGTSMERERREKGRVGPSFKALF